MSPIPPPNPPNPPNIGQQLTQLNSTLSILMNRLNRFQRPFMRFLINFDNFARKYNGQPNPNPNPNPKGPNPNNPNNPDEKRGLAQFQATGQKLINTIKQMDEIQSRALASNINLSDLSLPDVGLRISKLAQEILAFREEGIRDLNLGTMNLISRMKLTGQSTESLNKLISRNSVNLLLNTKQIQDLAGDLNQFGLTFGVRQDKLFDVANSMAQALKIPSIVSPEFSKSITESVSLAVAKTGGYAEEAIKGLASFLVNAENQNTLMAMGLYDDANKFITATAEEGSNLLFEIGKKASKFIEMQTGGPAGSASERLRRMSMMAGMFGGVDAIQSMKGVAMASENQVQAMDGNAKKLSNIATAQEKFASQMESAAKSLLILAQKFSPEVVGGAASVAGMANTVVGTVGSIMLAGNTLSRIMSFGGRAFASVGRAGPYGIAAALLATAGYGIYSYMKSSSEAQAESALIEQQQLQEIRKNKYNEDQTNIKNDKTSNLLDTLSNMVNKFGPNGETGFQRQQLELLQKHLDETKELNSRIQGILLKPEKASSASIRR